MANSNQQKISEYFSSLDFTARKRNLEKLKIDGRELDDPFGIDGDQWSEDLTQWADLEVGDLYTYLIDMYQRKTEGIIIFKRLQLLSQWICTYSLPFCYTDEWSILKARVNPRQHSPDQSHEAWVIINTQNGAVRTGHCTCKAG